jgi:hypothetical protein
MAAPTVVTFMVDSHSDLLDGDTSDGVCTLGSCSLRAALMQANKLTAPAVDIILPSGTYTLTRPPVGADGDDSGDLNLTTPTSGNPVIHIIGADAATTIINANQNDRVLYVHTGRTATLSGVTLRNGYRLGASGGGVYNNGQLTISDSVIESNQTDAAGGGIYSPGTLTLVRSSLRGNMAFLGGALWVHGSATIRDSTLYDNGADYGGGIEVSALNVQSQLIIVNSTLSQNIANTNGGGIDSEGDTFLYNTSVVDNDADHDHDQNGGIGGGVWVNGGSRFVVVNSLIARNTQAVYNDDDCNGNLEGYGWNLLGALSGCTFSGNGNASRGTIAPDMFGPLQNNGGPTWTHALLRGSAAIDATYFQGCIDELGASLTTDQRGAPRGAGAACDVGAFEYRPPLYLPMILR